MRSSYRESTYHGAQDSGRQPSQGLFHDASDVRQLVQVAHLRESAATDFCELCLCLLLDFWVEDHCLNKGIQSSSGRIRTSLQAVAYNAAKSARDFLNHTPDPMLLLPIKNAASSSLNPSFS
jgi:hypothetical protein